ncbi:MAG TPA: thiamine pyrophosphate-dependent enzyme [Steroidobacteraceae bacterium]|jgi:2-oxoisovalerate dehydrogenase E1 component
MPTTKALTGAAPWVQLETTQKDWDAADPRLLGDMLARMHVIRAFEEMALQLAGEGLVHGPAHSSIGQEGGAVGSMVALRADDQINGSHRGHHQFLAKSLGYLRKDGLDPVKPFGDDVRTLLFRALAEIMGLAPGFCNGRGGSMHLRWADAGVLGTNAIVGGGVPLAAGAAWAHKHSNTDAVAVTYFGDGAVNIGSVLETMNLASAWKLPLLFFIENNLYAVSTTVAEATGEPRLSGRGLGFGIPSWRVDGMDPLAVSLATQQALAVARKGGGPAVIEAEVYRYFHQNGSLPGSAFGYRTKEEEAHWRSRDPIERVGKAMVARGLLKPADIEALRQRSVDVMQSIAGDLTESAGEKKRVIRKELWPSTQFRDVGLRGDLSELDSLHEESPRTADVKIESRKFVDAIADLIGRRMELDPRIVVLGEDIHRLKGGTNGATRGLSARFPDRILGTPISENAFLGLGGGMAADGRFRPIVEFMYPDFLWVAADQVFNQVGKMRHMFGGDTAVPLVLRTKVAIGTGYGSQHSMDPAGIFATAPGWRIAAPSNPADYIGLMNAALACNDPVLMLEHVDLYQTSGEVRTDDMDYIIPPGKANLVREGSRATVLTYLSMVRRSMEAAEKLDADVDIVDLRWLDRASIDWDTIETSVRKTNNVLIVEQGSLGTSYGGWLADEIQRRLFDYLDAPVTRVTGGEASPSISKILERAAIAGTEEVEVALKEILR